QSRPITALPPALARPHFPVAWADADEGRLCWVIDRTSRRGVPLPLEDEVSEIWGLSRRAAALQNGMGFPVADAPERPKRRHGPRAASQRAARAGVAGLRGQAADEAGMQLAPGEETVLTRLIDALHELGGAARPLPAVARLVAERPPDAIARLAALPEAAGFN